ncbi:PREDICTED: ribosomal RNA small subunit methyltransferase NEP1 [Nanorana parkeri]|uniref:ribosomal RNA small subunit methyltransferase NEP1 n=1 Tax=Nanorana parkeri TaxID=125878 RepID=UPI0008544E86|nr:PREDICTED: ribosomal RNA small subunit methyltransferase NEP1 [Nanorana parkeri]
MAARRQHTRDEEEPAQPLVKRKREKRLIVLLEGASLETVRAGKTYELLNCDQHKSTLVKNGRDPGEARPDITHQCLLMLLDSPLNRAGLLQVYIHTQRNVLIEVNPQTRIPRTFPRFCGLMGKKHFGIKVIKNPITDHLPVGCVKVTTSFQGERVSCVRDLVPSEEPMMIVVGAFAHGSVNVDFGERTVSISEYPLSAALTCAKICSAFEEVWAVM